jgi:hypothetical protein
MIQENKHNHHSYKIFAANVVAVNTMISTKSQKIFKNQAKKLLKQTSNIPSFIKPIEKIQFISDLLHDLSYNFIQNYLLSDRIGKPYLCVDFCYSSVFYDN